MKIQFFWRSWLALAMYIFPIVACGEESRCDKACGPDYGFERGEGDNRVCFCETYDGRIYGPVPVSEEETDTETGAPEAGDAP